MDRQVDMYLKNKIAIKKIFFMPLSEKKAFAAFLLLQLYFVANLVSFGFWQSHVLIFRYLTLFYSAFIGLLLLLLFCCFKIIKTFNCKEFRLMIIVIFSLPLCFGGWLPSLLGQNEYLLKLIIILIIPCIFLYYRYSSFYFYKVSSVFLILITLSFMGHSTFTLFDNKEMTYHESEVVSLNKRPNIHVILLDAFAHSAFTEEFLEMSNPADNVLATLDDTIYAANMGFSEGSSTSDTWSALFELGAHLDNNYAFSGQKSSLLSAILRKNGYDIKTGFSDNYLGTYKGKYVDRYYSHNITIKTSLICLNYYSFLLGLCTEYSDIFFKKINTLNNEVAIAKETINLIDKIERNTKKPVFSAFYLYHPFGHAGANYQHSDKKKFLKYRAHYIGQANTATNIIKDIDRLRKRFPNSIFIVGGDHGPLLSTNAPKKDRRFIVLDGHSVALALLNASNLCPYSRDWLAIQKYLTPARMVAASLTCNGESRQLLTRFKDNQEFINFGRTLPSTTSLQKH